MKPNPRLDVAPDPAEEVHDAGEDDEQDAAARPQPQDLWQEALVEGTESLLARDDRQRRPGPAVLLGEVRALGRVLDARLDDVERRVEDGADGAADGAGDDVVADTVAPTRRLRKEWP